MSGLLVPRAVAQEQAETQRQALPRRRRRAIAQKQTRDPAERKRIAESLKPPEPPKQPEDPKGQTVRGRREYQKGSLTVVEYDPTP